VTYLEDQEEEEEDAVTMCRRKLLKKLREAKEGAKAIQNGNFTCRHDVAHRATLR